MRELIIFGCGGFGREILQILLDQNDGSERWLVKGFLVSPGSDYPELVHGLPVFDDILRFGSPKSFDLAVGIGNPGARYRVVRELKSMGVSSFPSLVHPTAWLGRQITIADGVVICAGARLTTDIALGEHCHINLGATIGHDSTIGAYSTLSPGVHISGRSKIGEQVELGTGACVNPGISVGDRTVVGSAAAVVRNLPNDCTAVGVPARIIKGT